MHEEIGYVFGVLRRVIPEDLGIIAEPLHRAQHSIAGHSLPWQGVIGHPPALSVHLWFGDMRRILGSLLLVDVGPGSGS